MKWQTSKYGWLLGHVQVLEPGTAYFARKGVEFTCLPESFRGYVYAAAAEQGWKASAMVFGYGVAYAFYRPTDLMRPNLPAYPIVKKLRKEG
jgi:hypothetical protein